MKHGFRGLLATSLLSLAACSSEKVDTVSREGEPPVSQVAAEDADMNRAMAEARRTLDEYRRRLENPPPTQSYLGLKVRFEGDGHIEHMWVSDVQSTPKGFKGLLANEPVNIRTLHAGDPVQVQDGDVSDWLAVDDGRLVAGYTLRVLRDRMSDEERKAFDAQADFIIED